MNYVVEVCYGDRNEWSNEFKHYCDALNYALEMSMLEGVSETHVYYDDEIIDTCVDGDYVEPADEDDEPSDRWDEVGYDPYSGCFDADL